MCFRGVTTRSILGLIVSLLAVALSACATPPAVVVTWSTGSEFDIVGFSIWRGDTESGPFGRLMTFMPASDDPVIGHDYQYIDIAVESGRSYWYRLYALGNKNELRDLGVIQATAP